MKNRAFTLVELLGVIVILGVIATITVPIIQRTILESTDDAYNDQVYIFERAAKNYVASDVYNMSSCQPACTVTLKQLQEKGFIASGEIINPKTDEPFNMDNTVSITFDNGKFSYNYDTSQDE